MTPPVFGIAGWKNSGKTTLMVRLIEEFARRGYKVAAVKHAHHGFDVDQPGRDSYQFRDAGAREVAIVSSKRVAIMHELRDEAEPGLEEILVRLTGADLVLIEGFKTHHHPKIEVRRHEAVSTEPLAGSVPGVVAIATDFNVDASEVPLFDLNKISEIADFITRYTQLDSSD